MLRTLRARLSYANVVATIALFVALGGSSYAVITITSKNVPRNALTGPTSEASRDATCATTRSPAGT